MRDICAFEEAMTSIESQSYSFPDRDIFLTKRWCNSPVVEPFDSETV